jgi:hypothetical protein
MRQCRGLDGSRPFTGVTVFEKVCNQRQARPHSRSLKTQVRDLTRIVILA